MTGDPDREALAKAVVRDMMAHDGFSALLGMEIVDVAPQRVVCRMRIRHDMLNGFGVCHGGATFALADSAFAFACNTQGSVTMSIHNSMTYPVAVQEGDVITAVAEEENAGRRVAFYRVALTNQDGVVVGQFRGTAYRTSRRHPAVSGEESP